MIPGVGYLNVQHMQWVSVSRKDMFTTAEQLVVRTNKASAFYIVWLQLLVTGIPFFSRYSTNLPTCLSYEIYNPICPQSLHIHHKYAHQQYVFEPF